MTRALCRSVFTVSKMPPLTELHNHEKRFWLDADSVLVQYQQSLAGSTQTGVPPYFTIMGLTTGAAEHNRRISATLGMKSLCPFLWLLCANTANGQMSVKLSAFASIMLMVLTRPLNKVSLVLAPQDTNVSQYLPSNSVRMTARAGWLAVAVANTTPTTGDRESSGSEENV